MDAGEGRAGRRVRAIVVGGDGRKPRFRKTMTICTATGAAVY